MIDYFAKPLGSGKNFLPQRSTKQRDDGEIVLASGETLKDWAEREQQKELDRMAQVDDEETVEDYEDCDSYKDNLEDR